MYSGDYQWDCGLLSWEEKEDYISNQYSMMSSLCLDLYQEYHHQWKES